MNNTIDKKDSLVEPDYTSKQDMTDVEMLQYLIKNIPSYTEREDNITDDDYEPCANLPNCYPTYYPTYSVNTAYTGRSPYSTESFLKPLQSLHRYKNDNHHFYNTRQSANQWDRYDANNNNEDNDDGLDDLDIIRFDRTDEINEVMHIYPVEYHHLIYSLLSIDGWYDTIVAQNKNFLLFVYKKRGMRFNLICTTAKGRAVLVLVKNDIFLNADTHELIKKIFTDKYDKYIAMVNEEVVEFIRDLIDLLDL